MSLIHDLPTASSISLSDELVLQQSTQTSKVSVEGLANKVGEVIGRNDNLLLNGWFKINQRGFTSGTPYSIGGYSIDRWSLTYDGSDDRLGTVTYNASNHSITFDNNVISGRHGGLYISQPFSSDLTSELTKTKFTVSAELLDGTIIKHTFNPISANQTYEEVVATNTYFRIRVIYSAPFWSCLIGTRSVEAGTDTQNVTIVSAKLEKGEISTLANDIYDDKAYEADLAACETYDKRFTALTTNSYIGTGVVESTTNVYMILSIPKMRVVPTVTTSGDIYLYVAGENKAITYSSSAYRVDGTMLLIFTGSGLTAGQAGQVFFSTQGSYINLDSEIH